MLFLPSESLQNQSPALAKHSPFPVFTSGVLKIIFQNVMRGMEYFIAVSYPTSWSNVHSVIPSFFM